MPAGIIVPTFPQRSPPWLLTTAACGGLRSTPDCRPRRALLHLSYSCATPCGPAILVTQGQKLPSQRLFNHLVGSENQTLGNCNAERFRGPEINDEIKLRCL